MRHAIKNLEKKVEVECKDTEVKKYFSYTQIDNEIFRDYLKKRIFQSILNGRYQKLKKDWEDNLEKVEKEGIESANLPCIQKEIDADREMRKTLWKKWFHLSETPDSKERNHEIK